jgi:LmbE family N-acetylglucosaminyl deacetylase
MDEGEMAAGRPAPGELGTVLGVWAHPDDEAYLSAGLMSAVRAAGNRVVVMTATLGDQGTDDPVNWPPERLAAQRRDELAESLEAIGVDEHVVFGYADGGCAAVPREEAVDRLVALLDDVKPDTVVTFGPEGMTGHSDHQTVSGWATEAWRRTGCRGRLWYATTTRAFQARWGELNTRAGIWADFPAPVAADDELAYVFVCDEPTRDRKFAALRAHRSQTAGLIDLAGARAYRDWWGEEAFVAATSLS